MTNTENGPPRNVFLAHNSCLNASYDFNLLKEGLTRQGFRIVEKPEDADEVFFSGCAVRGIWVDDAAAQINTIHERAPDARVTVTGCVASVNADRIRSLATFNNLVFGRHDELLRRYTGLEISQLDNEVAQDTSVDFEGIRNGGLKQLRQRVGTEKAEVVAALQQIDRIHSTQLETYYRRTTKGFVFYNEETPVEFITVSRSCPYTCSFCVIPRGRGEFTSVPLNSILDKARSSLARGIRRIVLVGDEVGNYGMGAPGPKFPDLLNALVKLDNSLRISIRYVEPKPFLRHADLLRRLCRSGQLELLYVSLQSASQRILDSMNRNYDIARISRLYETVRQESDTIFYCNWMVGFPGESPDDYLQTVALMKKLDLHINIAIPFSARPNTPAASMLHQVSDREKEERLKHLTSIIADMKAAHLAPRLSFLEPLERGLLLSKIRAAEIVQYDTVGPLINIRESV